MNRQGTTKKKIALILKFQAGMRQKKVILGIEILSPFIVTPLSQQYKNMGTLHITWEIS